MPRMLILDGNSLANRAFYALPPLTASDGRPTNVLHGFMTMLLRLRQEQKPDYWVVAFDKTKATVRIEQYAEYKAQRKPTPDGLKPQFDFLKEVLTGFSVPMLELAGFEADDLMATIATQAEKEAWEVQIYTGDRDALQLISPQTHVFLTKKGISEVECYDEQVLWDRYQLKPHQIVDLKGLMGDASDNIPGVPGVGEKTALKLLWQFGSVEQVLAHRHEVSGKKLSQVLEEYQEQALLSKRLATMVKDVPVPFSLHDFLYHDPSQDRVLSVLHKYELRNVARIWEERTKSTLWENRSSSAEVTRLAGEEVQSPSRGNEAESAFEHWPERTLAEAEWLEYIHAWQRQDLALTVQYEGLSPHWATWKAFGIGHKGEVYCLKRDEASARVIEAWHELLQNPEAHKTVVDVKALTTLLANDGLSLQGLKIDLALGAYLLNPARTKFTALDLLQDYFPGIGELSLHEQAGGLVQLAVSMESELEKLGLISLLHNVEEPLSPVLAEMERVGIRVDINELERFRGELKGLLARLELEIYELAGESFNINSTQQLGGILFEKLGLPPVKKTKTGYSTDAESLEELREAHPLIEKLLDYRQLSKLMSTYVNGLLSQSREGIIHTTFQQTVTATGRLSSTEPNLQNIPIRLDYGRKLRRVFRPVHEGWLLLSADYSQIELRILAHYSQDPLLCESFSLGQDVHTRTAAEVFGVPLDRVTSDLRRKAKAVNFGLVYGLTDFGLARDLGIPRREAKSYIEQYFSRYSGVKRYLEEVVAMAKAAGQVRTLLNRMRRIPELYHPSRVQRQFGERIAMNTPVQGTAADIMKLAMVAVAARMKAYQADCLLQVHDELVLQVAPEDLLAVAAVLVEEMEQALPLSVPLKVECKTGPNWYEMQPLEK
ncbi:MAG: DNA polymerase I [Desulfitobacteriaceae bacterium]|nr:DNA polymerase I [Desulfitobacteriaceae bacterium]MDI6879490.1 DNA polymerase I [Desulfitobacteriaceae bacterium]MDI6915272.1 DNA polymerase I [Desulfitobacteriaceae bacterium]